MVAACSTASQHLSLHQLTARELTPVELVDLAAELGCSHVGLFTCLPPGIATTYPCIATDEQEAAVAARMAATGVGLNNAEVFALRQPIPLAEYQAGLQRAARLGARMATVHVHEASDTLAHQLMADFCEMAAAQGMRAALEFTSFSAVRSLNAALSMLEAVGHPAACLAIDVLHFFRNGGELQQLQTVSTELIGYVQLCDGPLLPPEDIYQEAVANRCIPGAGEFPLVEVLRQLAPGVLLDVEVPRQVDWNNEMNAAKHAALAVESTRNLMRQAGWR